jgi:hypothetical protein
MENYAGGNGQAAAPNAGRTRNQQFDIDFAAIRAETTADYVVAGFTEILNDQTAATEIANRALALDPGLTRCVTIGVGITATGARDEYISIAWDPKYFAIAHAGQVLFDSVYRRWVCYNTDGTQNPIPPTIPLPDLGGGGAKKRKYDSTLAVDTRGLAYVYGIYNKRSRVFAFMHNMYALGDRSSAFTSLDAMMTAVHTAVGDNGTRDYVGGDFNIEPRNPGRGALSFAASSYIRNGRTYYWPTTWTNPYDFWLTNQGMDQDDFRPRFTNTQARVRTQTLYSHISDHAAITLRFPDK